ncbi:hypothetical protein [Streptomyces sp. NPDC005209]|uniref:hypothetical protein n=1 Tax=Streptomyces sp. NPDC005209 TaxID=3156715 RepID=UPI0033A0D660
MSKATGTAKLRLDPTVWSGLEDAGITVTAVAPAAPLDDATVPGAHFTVGSAEVSAIGKGYAGFEGGLRLEDAAGAFIELTDPQGTLPAGKVVFAVKTSTDGSRQRIEAFGYSLLKSLRANALETSFSVEDTDLRVTSDFAALLSGVLDGAVVDAGSVFATASAQFTFKPNRL